MSEAIGVSPTPPIEDAPLRALREAFAKVAERLTPDVEPAPIYTPGPPGPE